MKRLITLSLAIFLLFPVIAQNRALVSKELRNIAIKKEQSPDKTTDVRPFENPTFKHSALIPAESDAGDTWYDRQTNSTNQNRIYLYEDGTIGVIWTLGYDFPAFDDRGTGYNYFDGDEWDDFPIERIESQRCGWPSYAPLGENGEIIAAHIAGGDDDGLLINKRAEKGTGDWIETLYQGPSPDGEGLVWPRILTEPSNPNMVHLIALTRPEGNGGTIYQGQDGAFLYSRSSNEAETWEIENVIPEGMTSEHYTHFNGDTYDWATPKANTLAFVVGDPFYDCFLMKSTNNGDTWDKYMIWENPYPMWFNEPTDTFYCVDGSFDVELDMNGMAHVVFGINRAHSDGTGTYWFPFHDGVGYWNENMPAFSNDMDALCPYSDCEYSELVEDYNLIGWTQDVDHDGEITFIGTTNEHLGKYYVGLSSMVQLVMGDQNQLYVFFTSLTETYDNGSQNYRHLWSRVSTDGGLSWGPFTDLSSDLAHIFDEFAYPSCADNTEGNSIFVVCQIDNEPGMAVAGDEDPYAENRMVVMEVFKDEITGIESKNSPIIEVEISQNYPNPFSGLSNVRVELGQRSILGLQVYNLVGQEVYKVPPAEVKPGFHTLTINSKHLKPGVYFYTVFAGDTKITKKMVVE